jgi:hypothetical protein
VPENHQILPDLNLTKYHWSQRPVKAIMAKQVLVQTAPAIAGQDICLFAKPSKHG